uniref:Uncharacterized protein n=1 Tax=Cacopsylla melanoneura TaxID=428564 RepID=A0A8D8VWZ1_9HEMI
MSRNTPDERQTRFTDRSGGCRFRCLVGQLPRIPSWQSACQSHHSGRKILELLVSRTRLLRSACHDRSYPSRIGCRSCLHRSPLDGQRCHPLLSGNTAGI